MNSTDAGCGWHVTCTADTIGTMLQRMPSARARELVAAAERFPTSAPGVTYPHWYLHRWHFLPEGYLSRRSAAGYEHLIRNVYNVFLERPTIQSAVRALQKTSPRSVLEVGAGPGRLLEALASADFAHDVVGVELSPYLLERAHHRLKDTAVRLIHADGLNLPVHDGDFDAAVEAHWIGHLPRMVRAAAVRQLARAVRPGGRLVTVEHRWHPWPSTRTFRRLHQERESIGFVNLTVFERTEAGA